MCTYFYFFPSSDNERDTGAQNKNLWIPRHGGRRGQQTHKKDQGNDTVILVNFDLWSPD